MEKDQGGYGATLSHAPAEEAKAGAREVSLWKIDGSKLVLSVEEPLVVRSLKQQLCETHGFAISDVHISLLGEQAPLADDHVVSVETGSHDFSLFLSGETIEQVLTAALPSFWFSYLVDTDDNSADRKAEFRKAVSALCTHLAAQGLVTLGQMKLRLLQIPTRHLRKWWKSNVPSDEELEREFEGTPPRNIDWEFVCLQFARRKLTPRILPRTVENYVPYPGQSDDDAARCAAVRAETQTETLRVIWIFRPELGLCRAVATEDWNDHVTIGQVLPTRAGLHCLDLDDDTTPDASFLDPEDYMETMEEFGRATWSFDGPREPGANIFESMNEDEVEGCWKAQVRAAKERLLKMEQLPDVHRPGVPSLNLRFLLRRSTEETVEKVKSGNIESPQPPTAQEVEECLRSAKGGGKGAGLEIQCTHVDDVILVTSIEDGEDRDNEEDAGEEEDEMRPLVWRTAAQVSCTSLIDAVNIFTQSFPRYRSCAGKGQGKGTSKGKSFSSGWEVALVSFLPETAD